MKKPTKITTRRVALCGLFLALALIISLIESYIPPIIPALPYAKIGLGNVVLLACFLLLGVWEGYIVLVLRCLLSAVFAANMASLIWSLPSALVAYTLMILLAKTRIFSTCGLSIVGGMAHNFMQICIASLVLSSGVFVYLPYMMLAGSLAGFVTGILCHFIVFALKERLAKSISNPDNSTSNVDNSAKSADVSTENSTDNADISTDNSDNFAYNCGNFSKLENLDSLSENGDSPGQKL